ncbi:Non-reducing end [Carex littledalei]|uniref:Non-reducing end n=1 Tax=Carex littledalei TaxID=544730 RepID=A0A833QMR9_9POAL|nr:Non-reducing end [Carex littledalei]
MANWSNQMTRTSLIPKFVQILLLLLASPLLSKVLCIKECTNSPTQTELTSHTVRAQLSEDEVTALHEKSHSHLHLTPTDETTWINLMPRRLLHRSSDSNDNNPEKRHVEEFNWLILYRSIKGSHARLAPRKHGGNFLSEVSLHDIQLASDSIYWQAQQTNLEYLLLLDVDRLVWSFRKQAGLETPGHYMSATAMAWASTHNKTLFTKITSLVEALDNCQNAIGTGYLSAFSDEFFDRFEAIEPVWAPYYTIHKIMQGLLDQYTYAKNYKALEMVKWMAEYFANRVKNVIQKYSIERHYTSLNEETGGMNDVLYQLYTITKDEKHLILAHLFDKPCFLGLLAVQADSLSNFHANTHIPIVVGAQMRYEVTGDPLYKEIGIFFMDIVNSSHAYATGGTSVGEVWLDPKRLADTLSTETQESCTTYNMLKISRNLFRWTKEVAYADYYERALINGVLSIQRGAQPGVMIYMLPMKPDSSKAVSYHGWGTKFDSFWCCYGTGIESFSKLGDSIYFEEKGNSPSLYIIQFIPSTINWRSAGLVISQEIKPLTSSDSFYHVSLTVSTNQEINQASTLNIRIPSWTSLDSVTVTLNSEKLVPTFKGHFLSIKKSWGSEENLLLEFPINIHTEQIKDDRPKFNSLKAFLFGPYVLAGLTRGNHSSVVSDWISPVPEYYNSQLVSLTQQSSNQTLFISNSNLSLTMQEMPQAGFPASIETTFRIYHIDSKNRHISINSTIHTGIYIMIEPFDMPGTVITNTLDITSNYSKGPGSTFRLVPGLDGAPNSISLELGTKPGCYISTGEVNYACGKKLLVCCKGDSRLKDATSFEKAASFVPTEGNRHYNPISFVAKGQDRNFILEPLMGLRDEFYTVYFNIGAQEKRTSWFIQ